MNSNMFTMIIIKYVLFNFPNLCVIVSLFLIKSSISVLLILLTFSTNLPYSTFLTRPLFTSTFSLLKSTGLVSNLRIYNLSNFLHILPKLFATFSNLSIANLSISDFKLPKLTFLAKSAVSTLLSTAFF